MLLLALIPTSKNRAAGTFTCLGFIFDAGDRCGMFFEPLCYYRHLNILTYVDVAYGRGTVACARERERVRESRLSKPSQGPNFTRDESPSSGRSSDTGMAAEHSILGQLLVNCPDLPFSISCDRVFCVKGG